MFLTYISLTLFEGQYIKRSLITNSVYVILFNLSLSLNEMSLQLDLHNKRSLIKTSVSQGT